MSGIQLCLCICISILSIINCVHNAQKRIKCKAQRVQRVWNERKITGLWQQHCELNQILQKLLLHRFGVRLMFNKSAISLLFRDIEYTRTNTHAPYTIDWLRYFYVNINIHIRHTMRTHTTTTSLFSVKHSFCSCSIS